MAHQVGDDRREKANLSTRKQNMNSTFEALTCNALHYARLIFPIRNRMRMKNIRIWSFKVQPPCVDGNEMSKKQIDERREKNL